MMNLDRGELMSGGAWVIGVGLCSLDLVINVHSSLKSGRETHLHNCC